MTFKIVNEAPEHVSRMSRLHLPELICLPQDTQNAIIAIVDSIRKDFELAARLNQLNVDNMTICEQLEASTDIKFKTLKQIDDHFTHNFIFNVEAIRFDFIEAIA